MAITRRKLVQRSLASQKFADFGLFRHQVLLVLVAQASQSLILGGHGRINGVQVLENGWDTRGLDT